MSARDWHTVRELAAREGVTPRVVRAWVEKGAVEKTKLGPKTGVRVRLATDDDDAEA